MFESTCSKFEAIEYFYLTDFNAVLQALELELTAIEYRTLHYINSCLAHEVEVIDTEAAEYLDISLDMFYDIAALLLTKNLLSEIIFLGENNV